jgi:hypothetical protein
MLWHLRRDAEPAHRWLRGLIVAGSAQATEHTAPAPAPAAG